MQLFLFRLLAALPIETGPLPKSGLTCDPSGQCNPRGDLVIDIFNVIFGLLAGIAFISVVYGGFKYVISQGEPDKIGKAKDIIMYSLIGLVIAFSAFGIVNVFIKAII